MTSLEDSIHRMAAMQDFDKAIAAIRDQQIAFLNQEIHKRRFEWLAAARQHVTKNLQVKVLTVKTLGPLLTGVTPGAPRGAILTSFDFWNDLVTDAVHSSVFDPATKKAEVLAGSLGSLYGFHVFSDCYGFEEFRVLDSEVLILGGQSAQDIDDALEKMAHLRQGSTLVRITRSK